MTKSRLKLLSWGDFMMILYPLIICSIPKNGCCRFKVGPGQRGALELLCRLFLKPHSPGVHGQADWGLFIFLESLGFVSFDKKYFLLFLAFGDCSSNPSEASVFS